MYPATTPYDTASGVGVAPVAGLFPVAGEAREWSSRLLDCFDDFDICKQSIIGADGDLLRCSAQLTHLAALDDDVVPHACTCRLHDVLVPVHHVRADGGDRGPRHDVVRDERGAVRADPVAVGVAVHVGLLLHVPHQAARAARAPRGALRRLPRPPLLPPLRALPGVQGAQGARLRARPRLGLQRPEGRRRRRHVPAGLAGDGALIIRRPASQPVGV